MSSVSFVPKRQRSPEGTPIPQRSTSATGTSISGRHQLTPSGPVTSQSRASRWLDRNVTPTDMKVIKREQKRSESVASWMIESQRAEISIAENQKDLLLEQLAKANKIVELSQSQATLDEQTRAAMMSSQLETILLLKMQLDSTNEQLKNKQEMLRTCDERLCERTQSLSS